MQLTDRLDERTRELLADGFDAARDLGCCLALVAIGFTL